MIRPYEARDFEDCLWLNEQAYLKPCTENVLREKLDAGKSWVWEDSPLVIGCLITEVKDARTFVWSVTVSPNWRNRGIATALLKKADELGCELWLHTTPGSPAERLYTKLGYTAVRIDYDQYGPGSDAVLMVKR
jgi:ribosomal protein S18 acetylase RimI-like enzyme